MNCSVLRQLCTYSEITIITLSRHLRFGKYKMSLLKYERNSKNILDRVPRLNHNYRTKNSEDKVKTLRRSHSSFHLEQLRSRKIPNSFAPIFPHTPEGQHVF